MKGLGGEGQQDNQEDASVSGMSDWAVVMGVTGRAEGGQVRTKDDKFHSREAYSGIWEEGGIFVKIYCRNLKTSAQSPRKTGTSWRLPSGGKEWNRVRRTLPGG